jgi:hypothetical protein
MRLRLLDPAADALLLAALALEDVTLVEDGERPELREPDEAPTLEPWDPELAIMDVELGVMDADDEDNPPEDEELPESGSGCGLGHANRGRRLTRIHPAPGFFRIMRCLSMSWVMDAGVAFNPARANRHNATPLTPAAPRQDVP